MGKTRAEAVDEVEYVADIYRYYADRRPPCSPTSSSRRLGCTAFVRKAPIGSLLGSCRWNYPYYQVARFAGPT